jgi:Transcriptional regulator, AbiEi antitoxin, Type IV TA system/Transcriptional regulator, AbiEi antitoxin N-terminal domain
MTTQSEGKLNRLERLLPEGLLVDSAWLASHGYSTSLRSQYVAAGWLEQPARQVYRRKRGSVAWQQVVVSLQTLLQRQLVAGGRTALEIQGFAHYLSNKTREVYLYGPSPPPSWLYRIQLTETFVYRNSARLFPEESVVTPSKLDENNLATDLVAQPWGQWGWKLILSSPERAFLELLDEVPDRESFEQADKLVEGLANLSPRRLQHLLAKCRSVKVKRLFFFFADRHRHAWLNRINKDAIDLGKGKRMLVRGGKLNATYEITVPEEFHGVQ